MRIPRLDPATTALLIVDLQERFAPAIHGWERVVERTRLLIRAARQLDLPIWVTEQYPRGLGRTVADVADLLGEDVRPYEKVAFSACVDGLMNALREAGTRSVLVAGIEAHVCVMQTVLDLREGDIDVFVVVDAVSSRRAEDAELAFARMRTIGATLVSTEMALFELLQTAAHPHFKAIQNLIK